MKLNRNGNRLRWFVAGSALVLVFTAGQAMRLDAQAGVRRAAPKEHFQSGAQRSETLLADILATLRRLDNRIARIEKNVESVAAASRQGPTGETKRQR